MRGSGGRWKLDELIDFEVALAAWDGSSRPEGLSEGESRSATFKAWQESAEPGPGRSWVSALNWASRLLAIAATMAGFGAAWGCYDMEREGIHVVVFLCVTLFIPWLILLAGLLAWIFRPSSGGMAGPLLKKLANRFSGEKGREVMARIEGNPELARALGWRIASRTQKAAADYHFGAFIALSVLYFFRRVGFFWETTTETAMQEFLSTAVKVLSAPWAWFEPRAVPNIAASRREAGWEGGGADWMYFLLLALMVWGILPRWVLANFAVFKERRTLRDPAFQAPLHRKLWRVLTGVRRGSEPERPADGALVIDLGGISPDRGALRPFFLRHLRMNPVAWETLDVLDTGREESARTALGKAPAGIVLVAEGWSLAPRRMEETLKRVLEAAGGRRLVIHIADFDKQGRPREVKADERAAWEAFLDGQKGLDVELSIHEEDRTWAPG
ncbi:DUF2868 domain-containing protein [Luteolibacter sp. GHJ8]|uniref:DUF2868 domain-containing protein n=1 Tax=Luteolibacter rhizosphaerae TaxID=2989719 RepID=A0ABT3FX32_9BACT|nr:DUF2868 domain-containing protein [Luteolibacter rhizosphaerae]MCW1911972.1 DUF2868 domain-containing protein [Luteolibacter rhizosphaerae]